MCNISLFGTVKGTAHRKHIETHAVFSIKYEQTFLVLEGTMDIQREIEDACNDLSLIEMISLMVYVRTLETEYNSELQLAVHKED